MISFIVPAHNEELFLPKTLAAIHSTAKALNIPYEIVVADDASTGRTSAIARELGAPVPDKFLTALAQMRGQGLA